MSCAPGAVAEVLATCARHGCPDAAVIGALGDAVSIQAADYRILYQNWSKDEAIEELAGRLREVVFPLV